MREALSAAMATLTECEVIAFMSDSHLKPGDWVEVFVLASKEEGEEPQSPRVGPFKTAEMLRAQRATERRACLPAAMPTLISQ